ncbi:MAG: hypothetical protein AAF517_26215 [Planctomycetota bacterium]
MVLQQRSYVVLCLAVLSLARVNAATVVLFQHDLPSLVHASKYVVVAERLPKSRTAKETPFRVTRVLKGPMLSGRKIDVLVEDYDLTTRGDLSFDNETILFLAAHRDGDSFVVVPSGMRVVAKGRVYRVSLQQQQQGNLPQPRQVYGPVPQEREPDDDRLSPRGGNWGPVTRQEFEGDLKRAIRRVVALELALRNEKGSARREKLSRLLGAPRLISPLGEIFWSPGVDLVTAQVQSAFVAEMDLRGVLEAVSRTRSWFGLPYRSPLLTADALVAAALNAKFPVHCRSTAIWLMEYGDRIARSRPRQEHLLRLRPLLRSSHADLRRSVAQLFGQVLHTRRHVSPSDSKALLAPLAAAWEMEQDALVDATMLWAMSGNTGSEGIFSGSKKLPPGFVFASFEPLFPGVLFSLTYLGGSTAATRVRLFDWEVVVAHESGEEVRRESLAAHRARVLKSLSAKDRSEDFRRVLENAPVFTRNHAGNVWGGRVTLQLADPLLPGEYKFWLEAPGSLDWASAPQKLQVKASAQTTREPAAGSRKGGS